MADSTVAKQMWSYLPGETDKAGRIAGTVDKTTWRYLTKELTKPSEWLLVLWTSQLGENDDTVFYPVGQTNLSYLLIISGIMYNILMKMHKPPKKSSASYYIVVIWVQANIHTLHF